jgi:signal transduction histidine kinase
MNVIEGSSYLTWLHPDDIDATNEALTQLQQGQEILGFVNRFRHRDGSYRWLEWRSIASGNYTYSVARDITERKQQELITSANLIDTQLLHNLSTQLLIETDIQVFYNEILTAAIALTQANAGSIQILDTATQELLPLASQGFDSTLTTLFHHVNIAFNTSWGLVLTTGDRCFIDFDVPWYDDLNASWPLLVEAGYLSAQSTPLISRSGNPIGLISTLWHEHHRPNERELQFLDLLARQASDLIEQRQAEAELLQKNQELLRATQLKNEFLANMSHELRTPLHLILTVSESLQEGVYGELAPRQSRALNTIQKSGAHLLELISDILDIAKIEAGELSLTFAPTAIPLLCQASLSFVAEQARGKNIQLESRIPVNLPNVMVDERRLRQVLINLLTNAVKFTPEGGYVSFEVNLSPSERSDLADSSAPYHLRFIVTDTGIGIAPENMEKLFQPFIQLDSSLNRRHEGTGLGLTLVKRIVELHHGTIDVSTEVGRGSCFTVQLPCHTCDVPTNT